MPNWQHISPDSCRISSSKKNPLFTRAHFYTGVKPVWVRQGYCVSCGTSTALTPECQGCFPSLRSEQEGWSHLPARSALQNAKHFEVSTGDPRPSCAAMRLSPAHLRQRMVLRKPRTDRKSENRIPYIGRLPFLNSRRSFSIYQNQGGQSL